MKPLKQSELFDAILDIFRPLPGKAIPAGTGVEKAHPPTPSWPRSLRVLLVEDSVVNQRLMQGLLGGWGHEVVVAENGLQALQWFQRERFDLILMDIQMPEMDGYEVMRRIRALEQRQGGHVPILAITARAMRDERQKCLEAGADGYLAKPIRAAELEREMERVLRESARSAPAPPLSAAPAPSVSQTTSTALVAWEEALAATRQDHSLLLQIIEAFLQEAPPLLQQASRALAERSATTLKRIAHTLAGHLRLFGAPGVAEVARQLQDAAQSENWSQAEAAFAQLQTLIQQVFAELQHPPIQSP
jgi:CheY-like chemotaxis protein